MGSQQLLLLVLGVIVVGVATVAGLAAYSEGQNKARLDAATTDAMRIVADVQAWKHRPFVSGGASTPAPNFAGVSLKGLGYPVTSTAATTPYKTANGCYTLRGADTEAVLTVYADTAGTCAKPAATVHVTGVSADHVRWDYN